MGTSSVSSWEKSRPAFKNNLVKLDGRLFLVEGSYWAAELTCEFVSHSVDNLNGFLVERLRLDQTISN